MTFCWGEEAESSIAAKLGTSASLATGVSGRSRIFET